MRALDEIGIAKGRRSPLTEQQVRDFERASQIKLPHAYVALLLHSNGGHPELDTYSNDVGQWAVNNFFFLGEEDGSTESVAWNIQHSPLAPGVLPIARDSGGNLFALDLTQEPAPVLIWLHDTPGGSVQQIAPSLEAFVEGLHENPDYI